MNPVHFADMLPMDRAHLMHSARALFELVENS